jgi:hypothetical protein
MIEYTWGDDTPWGEQYMKDVTLPNRFILYMDWVRQFGAVAQVNSETNKTQLIFSNPEDEIIFRLKFGV